MAISLSVHIGGVGKKLRRFALTVLAAIVASTVAAPVAQAAPSPDYQPPPVAWGPCPKAPLAGRAECGFVTVPLDYAQAGRREDPARGLAGPAHGRRRASTRASCWSTRAVRAARGARSAHARRSVPEARGRRLRLDRLRPARRRRQQPALSLRPRLLRLRPAGLRARRPATSERDVAGTRSRRYAKACAQGRRRAARPPHDRGHRPGHGQPSARRWAPQQINYYGFSYGTYLGQVYATLFPSRVRRMVLDGNVDPRRVWYQANLDQDVAFEKQHQDLLRWIAKYDSVYHLGNDRRRRSRSSTTRAGQARSTHPAGGKIGPDEWTDIFLQRRLLQSRAGRTSRTRSPTLGHTTTTRPPLVAALRRHGGDRRRQRLRDLPRRPVHRRPVAEAAGRAGSDDNWRVYAQARRSRPGATPGTTRRA